MENTRLHTIFWLPFSALFAWTLPAQADNAIQVHWSEVCRVAAGSELRMTTVNGETVDGYCFKLDVDEIQVSSTTGGVIRITRAALSRIETQRVPSGEHQFSSLRKAVGGAVKMEAKWIFSPAAPLGIAALPATVAWGVVATPFCLLGDLAHTGRNQKQQIRVI